MSISVIQTVSVSCWGHENKEKAAERHLGALQKGEGSEGSLPIMEMGQQARCGTLYLLEYSVPNLRVSPNEAYHEAVICTTSALAQPGGAQPSGPGPGGSSARQSGRVGHLSAAVCQPGAQAILQQKEKLSRVA